MHSHSLDLIIALEGHRAESSLKFVEALEGLPFGYQVGLELFMNGGVDLVRELVHRKLKVFLDFRVYDRPEVVSRLVRQAAILHVDMMSFHLAGGSAMFRAIHDEFVEIPELRPRVFGIGALETFDDVRWAEVTRAMTGHVSDRVDSLLGFLDQGLSKWVDGLVCTLQEVQRVQECYPFLYTVVSGSHLLNGKGSQGNRFHPFIQAQDLKAKAMLFGVSFFHEYDPRETAENLLVQLGIKVSA